MGRPGDARMTDVMALTLMLFVQGWAFVNFRNTSVKGGPKRTLGKVSKVIN